MLTYSFPKNFQVTEILSNHLLLAVNKKKKKHFILLTHRHTTYPACTQKKKSKVSHSFLTSIIKLSLNINAVGMSAAGSTRMLLCSLPQHLQEFPLDYVLCLFEKKRFSSWSPYFPNRPKQRWWVKCYHDQYS